MNVFIYSLSDPITGELRYVGKAVDLEKRLYGHVLVHRSNPDKSAWIKRLRAAGKKPLMEVLEEFHESDDRDWRVAEKWWIAYLRSIGCDLFNLDEGGHGAGRSHRKTKEKISAGLKKFHSRNPEAAKIRASNLKGKKHSAETIAKMKAAQSNRSPETIEKMRQAAKRRVLSPQHMANFVAAGRKNHTPEIIERRTASLRAHWSEIKASRPAKHKPTKEEISAKLSAIAKAQWADPEKRARIHAAIKAKHEKH